MNRWTTLPLNTGSVHLSVSIILVRISEIETTKKLSSLLELIFVEITRGPCTVMFPLNKTLKIVILYLRK